MLPLWWIKILIIINTVISTIMLQTTLINHVNNADKSHVQQHHTDYSNHYKRV